MSENKYYPCIIIPGIGQSKTELVDEHGNKIKNAWPLSIDEKMFVEKIKKPFITSVVLRKDAGLSDKIRECLRELVAPLECKNDGSPLNHLRVVKYPYSLAKCSDEEKRFIYKMVPMSNLGELIGENNLYFFAYNSFGEPYKTVADLDEFIEQVKRETGSDKVNLVPVSMGGAVANAYFDVYGEKNDIHRVMYFVAAIKGSYLLADIMSGQLDPKGAFALIEDLTDKKTAETLGKATKLLPKSVARKMFFAAMDTLRDSVLMKCPSIWSVIPPEEYERLRDKFISGKEFDELREKTDRYFRAQSRAFDILKAREQAGTEFFAAVNYRLGLLPVSYRKTISSDMIIHSESSSIGATFAPLGETLCNEYERTEYVSPERDVDASTSLFPERVWFFREQKHGDIAYNKTALYLALKVLSDESFTDVHSLGGLPRFNSNI